MHDRDDDEPQLAMPVTIKAEICSPVLKSPKEEATLSLLLN